jgi:hypothetical protein
MECCYGRQHHDYAQAFLPCERHLGAGMHQNKHCVLFCAVPMSAIHVLEYRDARDVSLQIGVGFGKQTHRSRG